MKTYLLALAAFANVACADELVISQRGTETLYEGTLQRVYLDGVNGEAVFNVAGGPYVAGTDSAAAPVLGAWSVNLGGKRAFSGNCYPTFAYTVNHGSRLTLDCAP